MLYSSKFANIGLGDFQKLVTESDLDAVQKAWILRQYEALDNLQYRAELDPKSVAYKEIVKLAARADVAFSRVLDHPEPYMSAGEAVDGEPVYLCAEAKARLAYIAVRFERTAGIDFRYGRRN